MIDDIKILNMKMLLKVTNWSHLTTFPPSVLVQDLIEVDCFVSSPRASILRCLFAYTNYFIKKENCLFCLHVSFDGMWLVRYP